MSSWAHPKIRPDHQQRKAIVYLRQSSMKQVVENLESQRLQYALADRARQLGFTEIELIDCDLGASAAIGSDREGFDRVIAEVAQGRVGAVVSREVSRLSRTDKDWCHLLEVCQIFDTLILDEERVYDLADMDDQLILGIKGTLSVVELKVLKMRMNAGKEAKACRGELKMRLPPGFVHDPCGRIVLDPDRRVRDAIALVFAKYRELWSARQVLLWFRDAELHVPVTTWGGGSAQIEWRRPSLTFIQNVLRNPCYAGAYVVGRRPMETTFENGKLVKKVGTLREPEDCRVFLRDHHEGYISWEEFERIRERRRRNHVNGPSDSAVAAVRSGHGLLAGLLRCGHCGRKLQVRYAGKSGTIPRYFCNGERDSGGEYCLSFSGRNIDQRFAAEILAVVSPLGIEASLIAVERLREEGSETTRMLRFELQQAEYEVDRAFAQFDRVDPRNRLVADELERRWNTALEAREAISARLAVAEATATTMTPELLDRLHTLGESFPVVWNDPTCPPELRKKIVHTLVEEVAVTLEPATNELHFIIHWSGGSHSKIVASKPTIAATRTSGEALDIIRHLAARYGDDLIAGVLNRSGHRTGKGRRWSVSSVATARRRHSIKGRRRTASDPDLLTLTRAAAYCGVSPCTVKKLVNAGLVRNHQTIPFAPWEIEKVDLDSERVHRALAHMRESGQLPSEWGCPENQMSLNYEEKEDDNGGHYE